MPDQTIIFYKTVLDIKLKEIVFPVHLLSCSNISCDKHIADIENKYYLIVNACIISTSITIQYQNKVTSAGEISLRVGIENLNMLNKFHYSVNGCGLNVINQFLVFKMHNEN